MGKKKEFNIGLDVENIGPHYGQHQIVFDERVRSNKAVFFAANGTGKSFISRAFRLMSTEIEDFSSDDLLTIGKSGGKLSFRVYNDINLKTLEISIGKGQSPKVVNNTGYIFHTFNSDYVEQNVSINNYTMDGNISGYILGKAQIDLTEENKKKKTLRQDINTLETEIEDEIETAQNTLKKLGIRTTTKEFSYIDREYLSGSIILPNFGELELFPKIVKQLDTLKNIPEEGIGDITIPSLSINNFQLEDIRDLLSTSFPKAEWDEEFVNYIRENRDFIEVGLSITDDEKCPFCKQDYSGMANILIQNYKEYLGDKEAQVYRAIETFKQAINNIINSIKATTAQRITANSEIIIASTYFPSLQKLELAEFSQFENLKQELRILESKLTEKANDLTKEIGIAGNSHEIIKKVLDSIEEQLKADEEIILKVNKTKNDSNSERLRLRRELCKVKALNVKKELEGKFEDLKTNTNNLKNLEKEITIKEKKARISKKEIVLETLDLYLKQFFGDKYSLDKDTFEIKFLGAAMADRASKILSDGEKSIVAFCLYLASTHLLIEHEDDYDKLFFIIDDPVSSMDFDFVYTVAQSIKGLKNTFSIAHHERIWIFTHNAEFMSLLARNGIITNTFVMTPGKIEALSHKLIMPYESHLRSIVEIANRKENPSYTTANSIRHVIETVCKFEYPNKSLEKYVNEDKILSSSSCLSVLFNDLSHGDLRYQPPCTKETLIKACEDVVRFMLEKFAGQVEAVINK